MTYVRTPVDVQHVRPIIERAQFDAWNALHRLHAKSYLKSGKWGNLQFLLEGHYTSIPDMIKDRLLDYYFVMDVAPPQPKVTKLRAPRKAATKK